MCPAARLCPAAKPKVADYPFTTLVPNLGVCELDFRTTVFADVPGALHEQLAALQASRTSASVLCLPHLALHMVQVSLLSLQPMRCTPPQQLRWHVLFSCSSGVISPHVQVCWREPTQGMAWAMSSCGTASAAACCCTSSTAPAATRWATGRPFSKSLPCSVQSLQPSRRCTGPVLRGRGMLTNGMGLCSW